MSSFLENLNQQRWDDHRFYHHSLVNQSLHFVSSITFIGAYMILFYDPAVASLLGWLVAMTTRQSGHFFFEPKSYDDVNAVTHAYKEDVKVGYNLFRKWVLAGIWAFCPLSLFIDPTLHGMFRPQAGAVGFLRHLALLWLALAGGGLAFRMLQLFVQRDVRTGIVWVAKILTDPFNDFRLYRSAPRRLLRGERMEAERFSAV